MPRGNAPQTKVHYQGKEDDYIVFIESLTDLEKWKTDSSVPLAQILAGFKIFITHKYVFALSLLPSLSPCCRYAPLFEALSIVDSIWPRKTRSMKAFALAHFQFIFERRHLPAFRRPADTYLSGKIRQGAQGLLDAASKAQLENEFGTSNEDECIKVILHKGQVQETEVLYLSSPLLTKYLTSVSIAWDGVDLNSHCCSP
jgi:hypothetical protein